MKFSELIFHDGLPRLDKGLQESLVIEFIKQVGDDMEWDNLIRPLGMSGLLGRPGPVGGHKTIPVPPGWSSDYRHVLREWGNLVAGPPFVHSCGVASRPRPGTGAKMVLQSQVRIRSLYFL